VALNCLVNTKLVRKGKFKRIFVPPHCNDAGTSIGAALYLDNGKTTKHRKIDIFLPFWATNFSDSEILKILKKSVYRFRKVKNINKLTAQLLFNGEIVSYFQGGSEIGPRALGNRSILVNPSNSNIKDILNSKTKGREFFRPFGPIVLRKQAREFFEMPKFFTPSLYYMLFAMEVKKDKRHIVPGIVHVDNTSRVQIVDEKINPNLHDLLLKFYDISGIPVLLNTSFNKHEPIVHSPEDALKTFGRLSNVNYLIMGNYLIRK
jgi:carbamoyltransferase